MKELEKFNLNLSVIVVDDKITFQDFDGIKNKCVETLDKNEYKPFYIQNDADATKIREIRATINNTKKKIDRARIDFSTDVISLFEAQCNELFDLFDARQKELTKSLNDYKARTTILEEIKKRNTFTATLKFDDEKIIDKLKEFAQKNNCTLTIK